MNRYKLIVNVPISHADAVRQALGDAGAGRVGNYSHCSFSVTGAGRFLPNEKANHHIGERGSLTAVGEEQIQVDVMHEDMKRVIAALKETHPYEEIGYEIYQIVDESIF